MITIDGSRGEGGGQILRTALGLSLVTGKKFLIENIRAGRKKPGLLRQHLTAVQAATAIGQADVQGAQMGSLQLTFAPKHIVPGAYHFTVGTAGSATLVLQAILPALMTADKSSTVTLEGGTHNPFAPPYDFLEKSYLPVLKRQGPDVTANIERYGFFPAGGGKFTVHIRPVPKLKPLSLTQRGAIQSVKAKAYIARLNESIAQRELKVIKEKLPLVGDNTQVVQIRDSLGPGNAVTIELQSEYVTEVITTFGERKKPAEKVAQDAVELAEQYIKADVPVGQHLADQLLIPLALAQGGQYLTFGITSHTQTNIDTIQKFLPVKITMERNENDQYLMGINH